MLLELHVWGPAFSLPSIDQDCLAAIAYFTQVIPKDQWVLVTEVDEGSDLRQLPAVHDGSTSVCGFQNVVEYLKTRSHGQWDLDASLDARQKADCTAFSSLLTTQALPLLDLSLYVSSPNYNAVTRSAYSSLLSFPASWVIPTKRRAAAKHRSAHLGLSSLDLNSITQAEGDSQTSAAASAQIPNSLRKAKSSVSVATQSPETAARIRLQALTENVLDPLAALLTQNDSTSSSDHNRGYLLSPSQPSSLDCIAVAYLALFLLPAVPHPFLAMTLQDKYPGLVSYIRKGVKQFYGGAVTLEDAHRGMQTAGGRDENDEINLSAYNHEETGNGKAVLAWRDAAPASAMSSAGLVLREVIGSVPILGPLLKPNPVLQYDESHDPSLKSASLITPLGLLPTILAVVAGVGALGTALLYSGALEFGRGDGSLYDRHSGKRTGLADMGEAGEVLALGSFGRVGYHNNGVQERLPQNDSVPVASVIVEPTV